MGFTRQYQSGIIDDISIHYGRNNGTVIVVLPNALPSIHDWYSV